MCGNLSAHRDRPKQTPNPRTSSNRNVGPGRLSAVGIDRIAVVRGVSLNGRLVLHANILTNGRTTTKVRLCGGCAVGALGQDVCLFGRPGFLCFDVSIVQSDCPGPNSEDAVVGLHVWRARGAAGVALEVPETLYAVAR